MKPIAVADANKRFCPFTFGGPGDAQMQCIAGRCMAWHVVHAEHRREDHSGARDHLAAEGVRTGRIARREGGPASSGYWVLDEVGVCARLKGE